MAMYKVLSTKRLSPPLVEEARRNSIEIIEKEAISVQPIIGEEKRDEVMPWILTKDPTFVAFTSSNAVEAVKKYLHGADTWYVPNWRIFSLSAKTKDSLHPFVDPVNIIDVADNAKTLAQKIIEHNIKELLFFCGNKRRDELPVNLKKAGIVVHEVVIYKTIETPVIITESIDGVLFFSPSAVHSFFSVNQLSKNVICFAIGATTADAIKEVTGNQVITSPSPHPETMLADITFYFQNINSYK